MDHTPCDVDTDDVARRYDAWSFIYDLADRVGPLSRPEREWRSQVAARMRGARGWVLDAACGTGIMCRHFKATGFHGRLLAIDASRRMVHKVKAQARTTGLECSAILGDVTRLPVKSGSLAGIVCVFSLTTVIRPGAALEEFRRAMTDSSALVILDNEKPRGFLPRLVYPALVPISRAFCHTYIDRDVRGLLDASPGLNIVDTKSYAGGMAALYCCRKAAKSPSTW